MAYDTIYSTAPKQFILYPIDPLIYQPQDFTITTARNSHSLPDQQAYDSRRMLCEGLSVYNKTRNISIIYGRTIH